MSKMSDDQFATIAAVLPNNRFVTDDQIKCRCERIFKEFLLSAIAKSSVPSFDEVRSGSEKIVRHAQALRKALDPGSVQTIRLLYSVEWLPKELGQAPAESLVDLLPRFTNHLDQIIALYELPAKIEEVPALWNFIRGHPGSPPFTAFQRLVDELYNLFEEITHQVPTRNTNGDFMEFARAFRGVTENAEFPEFPHKRRHVRPSASKNHSRAERC